MGLLRLSGVVVITVFVVHVHGPQLVGVEQEAVTGFAGVQPGEARGEVGFVGETAGGEGFGEGAFAQLPGALGEIGTLAKGIGGGLLALPAGVRGAGTAVQGGGFGLDPAQHAGFAP